MRSARPLVVALFMAILLTASACKGNTDEPLLSYLTNSRLVVILKGTYATDSPLTMAEINGDQLFRDAEDTLDVDGLPAYSALPIFLDIGELRLSTKNFLDPLVTIDTEKDAEKFWDVLSPTRQVYCSQPYAITFDNDTCYTTGGLINYVEFMNGRGALYPSRDVGAGTYLHAGIFLRGIVTGFSKVGGAVQIDKFDNNDVVGVNVQNILTYDPGVDEATRQGLPPQSFPLHHMLTWGQQPQMYMDHTHATVVLELRFNLKENLMVHSITPASGQLQTVVGASDWRKAHVQQFYAGGNILTRARMFYPDITSDITISGGTASVTHYYALYGRTECLDPQGTVSCDINEWLPIAATPVRNGNNNVLKTIMPGEYTLQCRKDNVRDGYPEQVVRETVVTVAGTPGSPVSVALTCP